VLTIRRMPKFAATVVAHAPESVSRSLGRVPGRVGTTLGMRASIVDANVAMQRRLIAAADRMVVLNEAARAMLVANGAHPGRIALNRLGINERIARKNTGPTTAPIRFGFVGRLHRTKGIVELARAVAALPRTARFALDIVAPAGGAAEHALLTEVRVLLDGDPRVSFRGGVAPAQVPALLASLDVLLCPSTWFENGPTVAIESIAAGTPVIGTRLGNFTELIEDGVNGRLVAPGDVGGLSRVIEQVAGDPAMVDRWRAALPRPRTMDDIAAAYLSLYDEVTRHRVVA
jgi:glycosyltransferase involved in cell wall biosynthesis